MYVGYRLLLGIDQIDEIVLCRGSKGSPPLREWTSYLNLRQSISDSTNQFEIFLLVAFGTLQGCWKHLEFTVVGEERRDGRALEASVGGEDRVYEFSVGHGGV